MSDQKPMYNDLDPVHVMTDNQFFFNPGQAKINENHFAGPGVIKAYAPWCPHCRDKVKCINILATILKEEKLAVYVINADDDASRHFSEALDIKSYPTFLEVDVNGVIRPLLKPNGSPVGSIPDIVVALCKNQKGICDYAKHLKTLNGNGC